MRNPKDIKKEIAETRKARGETKQPENRVGEIESQIVAERKRLETIRQERECARQEAEKNDPVRIAEESIRILERQREAEAVRQEVDMMKMHARRLIELAPKVDLLRAEALSILDEIDDRMSDLWRRNERLGKPFKVLLAEVRYYLHAPSQHKNNFPHGFTFAELLRQRFAKLLDEGDGAVKILDPDGLNSELGN